MIFIGQNRIFTLSSLFFDHTYWLLPVLREAAAADLYKYLIFYSLLQFLFRPSKATANFTERLKITSGKNNITLMRNDIVWVGRDPIKDLVPVMSPIVITCSIKELRH